MKKITALFIACTVIISSFSIIAGAVEAEYEEIVSRYMCDINCDGEIKAEDARVILRASVGLENLNGEDYLFCDADGDGAVKAADARIALRTSVGLEAKTSSEFIVYEKKAASCTETGYIKAECSKNGVKYDITLEKLPHDVSDLIYCVGEDTCKICNKVIEVPENHPMKDYPCEGRSVCTKCGYETSIAVSHKLENGVCTLCGYGNKAVYYEKLIKYVKDNGKYNDGIYYVTGTGDYEDFALCYDAEYKWLYVEYYMYVNVDGYYIDYFCFFEIPADFKTYTSEVDAYLDDSLYVYTLYNVDVSKLSSEKFNNAVSLVEYESAIDFSSVKNDFAIIAEGSSILSIEWLVSLAPTIGINLTKDMLGCPQL